jgi:hypothetical protein
MDINIPAVLAELEAAFTHYEAALVGNDIATLTALFRQGDHTVRYGTGENLYGSDAILAFRAARAPAGLARRLERTVITTYGRDFGTTATLFRRDAQPGRVGRQMQSWVRFAEGWQIVAAHVSLIDDARSD